MALAPLDPVHVDGVELCRVRLPLRQPWVTNHGAIDARALLLVRVMGPDAEGWGECAALEAPGYSAEYVDGAADVLRRFLLPALCDAVRRCQPLDATEMAGLMAVTKGHPMAKAAVEMALLDAQLRRAGVSLGTYFGATRRQVPAGVAVGLVRPLEALIESVAGFVADGYRRVKLKIRPGWDVEPVAALRDHFGDDLLLQVDANGAYAGTGPDLLAALDPYGLLLVEQPLADDDLAGHAELARHIATPVCLDESITSAAAAAAALDLGACGVVNLKPGRVGGYLEAVRVHDLCVARHVPLWLGGMLESGLARTANVALAALPGFTLPGDLSGSHRFYEWDLTAPLIVADGHLAVPDTPGAGAVPLPDALDDCTESTEWIPLR